MALDRLGRHDEAVAALMPAYEASPKRYETLANLGTFHLHAGRFEAGLQFIRAAIEVNPDAHFGREIIQQRLVEYVIERRGASRTALPLDSSHDEVVARYIERGSDEGELPPDERWIAPPLFGTRGFAAFVERHGHTRDAALAGVLGMMRFSDHRHPMLLEVLGDLLIWDHRIGVDAKRLAARAWLRAADAAASPTERTALRARAAIALVGHRRVTLAAVERRFRRERARGDRLTARIERDERRWIERGVDPEARFERKYLRRR